jgi:endo-1,4-beta-xylanase
MPTRRSLLARLALAGAAGVFTTPSVAGLLRASVEDNVQAPLRALAAQRGIVYGSAVSSYELRDPAFAASLAQEAAILVPEYEMKRGVIEETRGRYDFSGLDLLLAFARTHGMAVRGHPLVWHRRNPDWLEAAVLSERDPGLQTGYIDAVMRHGNGRIRSWDVVNEAISPEDGRADNLRNTFWLQAFGPSYIDVAFHTARNADPTALLVYNDWGCEGAGPKHDRFRAATLDFLEKALARGVPIDGLGLQDHLQAFGPPVDQSRLRAFLGQVQQLGLKILVTEHDVDDSGGPSDIVARDQAVADASRRFLEVVLDNSATEAVLTWGLSDRFLQSPGWRDRLTGYSPRTLPLDADLQRTAMWRAMARTFAAG